MTEAKHCALELNGNLADLRRIVLSSTGKNAVDHPLANEEREELMEDHPLVVPRGEPAGAAKHLVGLLPGGFACRPTSFIARDKVYGFVVKEKKRSLEASDDQVLIVARVRNNCGIALARQVFEWPPLSTSN